MPHWMEMKGTLESYDIPDLVALMSPMKINII